MLKLLKIASVLAASALLGASAYADSNYRDDSANNMLLDTLVQKGYLTHEEAAGIGETVTPFKANGGHTSKITVNGLLHFGHDLVTADKSGGTVYETADTNAYRLSSARLGVRAVLTPRWSSFVQLDFADTEANSGASAPKQSSVSDTLDEAWIRWVAVEEELVFDMGYIRTSFGFEYNKSIADLKTIHYSPASFYFREVLMTGNYGNKRSRFVGMMAHGTLMNDFYYNLAVTRPQANQVNVFNSAENNTAAIWGGFGWNTAWQEIDINIGINGAFLPEQPAGTTGCAPCDDTLSLPSGERGKKFYFWGAHMDLNYREFSLFAEVMGAILSDQKGLKGSAVSKNRDANPIGLTIMPTYRYNEEYEFVFAYSYVDADSGFAFDPARMIPGMNSGSSLASTNHYNKMNSVYLGTNWYILANDVKLSFGYQFSKVESPTAETNYSVETPATGTHGSHENVHALRSRLQLVF